jgi:hypothetical protein
VRGGFSAAQAINPAKKKPPVQRVNNAAPAEFLRSFHGNRGALRRTIPGIHAVWYISSSVPEVSCPLSARDMQRQPIDIYIHETGAHIIATTRCTPSPGHAQRPSAKKPLIL